MERVWLVTSTELHVRFSERVEAQSATQVSNYSIESGVNVLNAILETDEMNVVLTTSEHAGGQKYALMVSNVRDQARVANVIAPNSRVDYENYAALEVTNLNPS
jgi:hypothetical protein